ncbi:hypothetical protein [Murdochiella massiliensis]|uniref:hypothetical protein n=1 Tax=Murdochiella massiliensis TaxID=1673723 RepID=UPI00082A3133|nr:hypothetical protein [Murdochiella massiliensis]
MRGFVAKTKMIQEDEAEMTYEYAGYNLDESRTEAPKLSFSDIFTIQKDALQEIFEKEIKSKDELIPEMVGLGLIDVQSDGKSGGTDSDKINSVARLLIFCLFHEAVEARNFQKRSRFRYSHVLEVN